MLGRIVRELPPVALQLAEPFGLVPLTLILPRHHDIPASVSAGLDTVAVACLIIPIARALIEQAGACWRRHPPTVLAAPARLRPRT
jgi:tRNA A37 threonylcarbamoyladenosine synthetase subunit TsaC/SUA5/YrdC